MTAASPPSLSPTTARSRSTPRSRSRRTVRMTAPTSLSWCHRWFDTTSGRGARRSRSPLANVDTGVLDAQFGLERRPFGLMPVIGRGGEQPVEAGDELVSLEGAVAPDLVGDDQTPPLHPREPGIEGLAGLTGIGQLVLVEVLHPRCSGSSTMPRNAARSSMLDATTTSTDGRWSQRGPEPTTPTHRASASSNVGPHDRGSRCRDGSVPPTPRPTHDGIRRETARPAKSSPSAVG